jgi:hypothetical protein
MLAAFIGYCCKKTDFDDDHVFQEEELPTIFYNPEDPPSIGKRVCQGKAAHSATRFGEISPLGKLLSKLM